MTMLCCPQHRPFLYLRHHYYDHGHLNSTITLHLPSTTAITICSSLPNYQQQPQNHTTTSHEDHVPILRTHNYKTNSLLLHHLKQPAEIQNTTNPQLEKLPDAIPPEEKVKLEEISLITKKRLPRFPGSIFPQSPTETLSPLQALFENNEILDKEEEEEMVMRALEVRRKVTMEIFKDAMRKKGKFGITYSTNVAEKLEGFIDVVMIEAAAMKRLPEYENSSFNLRARTVIEDLEVVPLIRWLKHHKLSYPRIAKLIIASRGDAEAVRKRAEWLKSIHVRGEFIGVVLTKAGENILERSRKELDEIVAYLESNGVRRDWMGYVISRCPQLLCYSMEEVKTRVGFFLDMGMNEKDFGTMVFDYPGVLGKFSLEEMNQKVNYLKEFGLNNEEVGRLLAFKPQLMGCSIEETWKPLVKYFYYLGISQDGMRRMLMIKPMVFCVDLEKTIVPKVQFFQDLGIHDDAIGNMLVKFPPLLTYSLHKKIRRVVIFLMANAGVSQRNIGKVIASGPELLGCSIGNKLDINMKYFLSLGISHWQLGEMIADFPMLLRYKVDLLRPKYQYLRRTMVRPLKDLIEFPRFFSYSLDERIIPRHKIMVENQINFKLRYMLACNDEEFEKKVKAAVERRQRFESGEMDDDSSQVADNPSEEKINSHLSANDSHFSDSEVTDPLIHITESDSLGDEDFDSDSDSYS